MSARPIARLGSMHGIEPFQEHLKTLGVKIPCDPEPIAGADSPLAKSLARGRIKIANRIAVQPMEGWDGSADGNPSEHTIRRWQRFGQSGAKLIWGGEAVAVSHSGRANPNQLVAAEHTKRGLAQLRSALLLEHRQTTGSEEACSLACSSHTPAASAGLIKKIAPSLALCIAIPFWIAGWD